MRYFRVLSGSVLILVCAFAQTADETKTRVRAARDLSKEGSAAIPKLQAMLTDSAVEVRI